jgi:hypothetical protein
MAVAAVAPASPVIKERLPIAFGYSSISKILLVGIISIRIGAIFGVQTPYDERRYSLTFF